MLVTNNAIGKKYNNGDIIEDNCSHYNNQIRDIVIYLPQLLEHSIDCKGVTPEDRIEHSFTQTVTHEVIHALIHEHVDIFACVKWDNLGSVRIKQIEGRFSLRNLFGGMLDKEV